MVSFYSSSFEHRPEWAVFFYDNGDGMITLVIGVAGSGKTHYCKTHLGDNGLCYDLDALEAAFRLSDAHKERNITARRIANALLFDFLDYTREDIDNVFVIRTAPGIKEIAEIDPDCLVICTHQYVIRKMDDENKTMQRIKQAERYCKEIGISVKTV